MEAETPNLNAVRFDYAQIGGVRLHYAEYGAGERLVILLHGFPEMWYSWRHQLEIFGSDFKVVAPDLRGYNLSDKPPRTSDYEIDNLIDDVTGLIHHFGKERAVIIGHDWGAVIAWALAAKYPSYVEKLVALQVPPMGVWRKNMTATQAFKSWYMLFFQLPRVPEWWLSRNDYAALAQTFKRTVWRRGAISDHDIEVYKNSLKREGSLTAAINYYRANLRPLFTRHANETDAMRIQVPTLFIFGERDFAIAPESVQRVGSVVDATYKELRIATAGHWVQQEAAREVNEALKSFVQE